MECLVQIDIEKCFPSVPHKSLLKVIRKYIKDKPFVDLVSSWLCGPIITEDGISIEHGYKGLPQGSPLSPVLFNLYLHDVYSLMG